MSANALDATIKGESPLKGLVGLANDTYDCDPVKTRRELPYKPWQDIAAEKKAEQLSRIPRDWHIPENLRTDATDLRPLAEASAILTDLELEITSEKYDATSLLAKIADGTFTAADVVTAFCKRAAVAQQVCNCLTEIMFFEAIEAAKELDKTYKQTGKTVGPLHGLPMTFKVSVSASREYRIHDDFFLGMIIRWRDLTRCMCRNAST